MYAFAVEPHVPKQTGKMFQHKRKAARAVRPGGRQKNRRIATWGQIPGRKDCKSIVLGAHLVFAWPRLGGLSRKQTSYQW